jgi:hypothetical protein
MATFSDSGVDMASDGAFTPEILYEDDIGVAVRLALTAEQLDSAKRYLDSEGYTYQIG